MPEEGRRRETTLGDRELVLAVRLPPHPEETRSIYLKAMDRGAFSFALVGVAAVMRLSREGRRVEHARVVLSGVALIPWRAHAAERILVDAPANERVLKDAAQGAVDGAVPLRLNGWKIPLVRTLVQRALQQLIT